MAEYFINPVCNIPVQKSTAKHVINRKGVDYYFCCDGCRDTFVAQPEKYELQTV
jgi:YHS domain-containing protein